MVQHTEGRPSLPLFKSSSSGSTLRSETTHFKSAYSNQIPTDAQNISGKILKRPAGSILALVLEIVLCLVALCFIALALGALCINNRPTGDRLGTVMEEAMKLGPTIYPIIFAALLSSSLKSIGRYCAQKSVRMSTLWALMNTNSTSDPIKHLYSMPLSLLVWGLLVLWAMSPLGGQSAIRLLYKANLTDITHPELRYWDNGPLGSLFTYTGIMVGNDGSWPLSMRDLYTASLMQSIQIKEGPVDQWTNVKIPRLEAGNESATTTDGWMPVGNTTKVEDFTSLFGMPIIGLSEVKNKGDVHFSVETMYLELSCSPFRHVSAINYTSGLTIRCKDCFEDGMTQWVRAQKSLGLPADEYIPEGRNYDWGDWVPTTDHPVIDQNNPNNTLPRTIQFISTFLTSTSLATCQITQRPVEAYIECIDKSCAATKIRQSTTDHRNKNFTVMDYWGEKILNMITAISSGSAAADDVMWGSSSSELFLNDSRTAPIKTGIGGIPDGVNMSTFNNTGLFATRASMLLNTGLQAFMAPTAFSGNLKADNLSFYGKPHIPSNGLLTVANESAWKDYDMNIRMYPPQVANLLNSGTPFIGASTNATLRNYTEVYKPEYVWVVILIISSFTIVGIGITGLCFRMKTIAPDMFDCVMGLTYDNPYILPTGNNYEPLDTDNRLKILGNKTVQLGELNDGQGAKAVFGEASFVAPFRMGVSYH
ncbi:hypothetical protein ASPVEDRAFT_89187 [Aspergillus versicolor CBS 583.65]|uniref:Uncharacterized protein n=1 Tax=Aspergillus versicolor CBS 583.65 TaxID=1036611 RepID=A0A1L9Q2H0_ASPVE|nr:uncharacterized protein ASPVEDRAFT_89187 [Aspergillus versicolor CBS 583.65]OJJ07953.1 hypothetical protein ASPVEDRAFT_89187 [Aspergillus versicolor CBS 583.65]